jgi:hypothetical protein
MEEKKFDLEEEIYQIKTFQEITGRELEKISQWVRILLRRDVSIEEDDLFNEIQKRRFVDVNFVENFMGWTNRNHSLKKMKEWGLTHTNLRFRKGTKSPQVASKLIWMSDGDKSSLARIKEYFDKGAEQIPMRVIMKLFGVKKTTARDLADLFKAEYENFVILENYDALGEWEDKTFLMKQ